MADSPLGVRVVSVEESSQASLADLRPQDLIVRIEGAEVRSIDEFSALSMSLKGRAGPIRVLIFRHGVPNVLALHLYSYPILTAWRVEFVPDHDIRFADPRAALDYWARLGRGFDDAGKPDDALNAYLNGLHNAPADVATALKATELFSRRSQQRLEAGEVAEGLSALRNSLLMLERLFDESLTEEQLQAIRAQLKNVLRSLSAVSQRGGLAKEAIDP